MTKKIMFDGRHVGDVIASEFVTHRNPEHYFRKYQGFAISSRVLALLNEIKVERIRLIYHGKEAKKILLATVQQFEDSEDYYKDAENDVQKVLAEEEFR